MRSELGKLMWLARIARPGAIYDASAFWQNFANFKPGNNDGELLLGEMKRKMLTLAILNLAISNICRDSESSRGNKSGSANMANLSKQRKKAYASKTHFAVGNLLF